MRPVISHPGILYLWVRVKALTAHAAQSKLWLNAIGKMINVYEPLMDLDQQRGASVKFALYRKVEGRSCHLNIGTLKAGDWVSTVAGFAASELFVIFMTDKPIN